MVDIGQSGLIGFDEVFLVELFPVTTGSVVTPIYLATRDVTFPSTDATAPNREYDGRVRTALDYRRELFRDGRVGGIRCQPTVRWRSMSTTSFAMMDA
jgi:hypothetical protein